MPDNGKLWFRGKGPARLGCHVTRPTKAFALSKGCIFFLLNPQLRKALELPLCCCFTLLLNDSSIDNKCARTQVQVKFQSNSQAILSRRSFASCYGSFNIKSLSAEQRNVFPDSSRLCDIPRPSVPDLLMIASPIMHQLSTGQRTREA